MKRELISQALSNIDDKYISESAKYRPAKSGGNVKVVRRILVLAAVVALLMALGATAYAKGWLGLSPLVVPTETPLVIHGEEHETISISQPQAVPEELPEVNELAENNKQAWQEFQDRIAQLPETLEYNQLEDLLFSYNGKDTWKTEFEDNEDGTVTVIYKRLPDDFDLATWDPSTDVEYVFLGTKDISTEDYERFWELTYQRDDYQCEYDFHYLLHSDKEKAILEDVATKYGLNLRKEGTYAFWDDNGKYSGDGFYSTTELVDMTSAFCKGNIFNLTPSGFDKLYWYDEGTFGVSFMVDMPDTGKKLSYYGYNSVYTTLSSGKEVTAGHIKDTDSYQSKTHVCPDGTEIEVMYNDREAYFYVYLEDSFFAGTIDVSNYGWDSVTDWSISEADIDYALDSINYSLI